MIDNNPVRDFLNQQVAMIWGAPISLIETLAFITGAICVWGVTRQAVWNWPIGLANNAAFGYLFLSAGLYAETVLQVVFAVIGIYGWWAWTHGSGRAHTDLPVRRVRSREAMVLGVAGVAGTVIVALALTHGTDSTVPWPDAFVLAASLVATYGQARKIIESWWVWIAVDLVSIPLYFSRGLNLTAVLYIGFTALCIRGLYLWNRDLSRVADRATLDSEKGSTR